MSSVRSAVSWCRFNNRVQASKFHHKIYNQSNFSFTVKSSRFLRPRSAIPSMTTNYRQSILNKSDTDILLFQYKRDPRAHQFRSLLDYFQLPYHCIEVQPRTKIEFNAFAVHHSYHHSPYLRITDQPKMQEQIKKYKKECSELLPMKLRSNLMQIADIKTFKQRIEALVDEQYPENRESMKSEAQKIFDKHEEICDCTFIQHFNHSDLYSKFLPFLRQHLSVTMSNDHIRNFFGNNSNTMKNISNASSVSNTNYNSTTDDLQKNRTENLENEIEKLVEFYCNEYSYLLKANQCRTFSSAFQLMSYLRDFKVSRKWTFMKVDLDHLLMGFIMRLFYKGRYAKIAKCGSAPRSHMRHITGMFFDLFDENGNNENSKQYKKQGKGMSYFFKKKGGDEMKENEELYAVEEESKNKYGYGLKAMTFHGGRQPDIFDILIFGALRACEGLDLFYDLKRKNGIFESWYQQMNDEIGNGSCFKIY